MKITIHYIVFIAFTAALVSAQSQNGNLPDVGKVKEHLEYLGSDLFAGRAAGSIGAALAAKYLALNLEQSGIQPAGDNNTFYQYVPMHGASPHIDTELKLFLNDNGLDLKLKKDFLMYGSGDRRYIPNKTELVFAGYGIIAPEFDYNDYESIEAEGKIIVVLGGEPNSNREDFFDGAKTTVYSYPGSKQRIALSRGALGTIIIPATSNDAEETWRNKIREFSFEDVYLAYSVTTTLNLVLNPVHAEMMFGNSEYSWGDIESFHNTGTMKSFAMNAQLTFKGEFIRRDFIGQNVAGLIRGGDYNFSDRCIIVSAHYDHLGIGTPVQGDSVYNGVFDNAIGSAVLLELADQLARENNELKRSVLFLFVTGEEKGLLGSRYYTDHPIFPLYKTSANINIDGVPFIDSFNSVVAFGYKMSSLKNNIDSVSGGFGLYVQEIPQQFSGSETFNRSDQIAFANAGIPSILVMDGTDYKSVSEEEGLRRLINYANNIYHTPFDDLSQSINYTAVAEYVEFMKALIINLANDENEPEWNPGASYRMARLRSIAEKK